VGQFEIDQEGLIQNKPPLVRMRSPILEKGDPAGDPDAVLDFARELGTILGALLAKEDRLKRLPDSPLPPQQRSRRPPEGQANRLAT